MLMRCRFCLLCVAGLGVVVGVLVGDGVDNSVGVVVGDLVGAAVTYLVGEFPAGERRRRRKPGPIVCPVASR